MTPQDQEKLFKAVQKHFGQNDKWSSGYVHGVVDGLKRSEPRRAYIRKFEKGKSDYAIGYIFGFIDAYGADALLAEWNKKLSPNKMEYRWWENAI